MKRILCYAAIIGLMLAAPVKRMDVAKLRPVQVVSIYKEGTSVVIRTDTEDKGYGETAILALQNLENTSNGIIYLDTAEYLLLTEETLNAPEELRRYLKKDVRLCLIDKPVDLVQASGFLDIHGGLPMLKAWENAEELPVLSVLEDSFVFLKKSKIVLDKREGE